MNLNELISSVTYSPVADISAFILSITLIVIIKETSIKTDSNFKIIRATIMCILIASISNVLFDYLYRIYPKNPIPIYILRDIYHSSLLFSLALASYYIVEMIGLTENYKKIYCVLINILLWIGILLDVLSPITKFGFRMLEDGSYIDSVYLKPYTISYIGFLLLFASLLIIFKKMIFYKIRRVFIFSEILVVTIIITENIFKVNTFTTLTFLLPLLVAMIMMHSHSYNIATGAAGSDAFDDYLHQRHKDGKTDYFMCLKLFVSDNFIIPPELGRVFYGFWEGTFKNASLYCIGNDLYVLAIKSEKENNIIDKIKDLVNNAFPIYFEKFKYDYKTVVFKNLDFCDSVKEFVSLFNFFAEDTEINTSLFCGGIEFDKAYKSNYIVRQLKDISEHANLDDERVLVYCQPVKNVKTGVYDTAESLMRLNLPEIGIVYPNDFIHLAEEYNLIHKLSLIIFNKTCKEVRTLIDEGYDFERISVNFSIIELRNENFIAELNNILDTYKIPTGKIAIELTESKTEEDFALVLNRIEDLKNLGIHLYLDDFGTGYSNFDRMLSLNLNVVKFDRSLLMLADKDENSRQLIKYFSAAFTKLGYEILFEGVETDAQEDLCIKSDADYLQGYKFSKPIPIKELRGFLNQKKE